jgi:hypothetical protein
VSKEYGWSDDQILDLTVRRFRQIVAAIRRRLFLQRRDEISLMTWQTRQLASFVAAGYMTDGKHGNPALDAAQKLAFDEIEAEQIKEAEIRLHRGGELIWGKDEEGKDTVVEIVPDLSNVQSDINVMNAFGDPSKWRARG